MSKRRPSILWRAAGCLMLGLATTATIAWIGAAFEKAYHAGNASDVLVFDKHTSRSYVTRGWFVTRNIVNWDFSVSDAVANPGWINAKTEASKAAAPYWSQAWRPDKPNRPRGTWGNWPHDAGLDEVAAGWPFRALYAESDEPVQDPQTRLAVYTFRGGISLPTHVIKDGANIFLPRCLPMRPIWPGLAANVAIFSLLWGLIVLPVVLVVQNRLRRGRCLGCGYDLQGLTPDAKCPECGAVRAAVAV